MFDVLHLTIGGARNNPLRPHGLASRKPRAYKWAVPPGVTQQCRSELKLGPRLSRPRARALHSRTHLPRPHAHTLWGSLDLKQSKFPVREKFPLPTPCSTMPESPLSPPSSLPGRSRCLSCCPSAWYYSGLQGLLSEKGLDIWCPTGPQS